MSPLFLSYFLSLFYVDQAQNDGDNNSKKSVLDRIFDLDTKLGMEGCELGLAKAKETGEISEETRIFWEFLQNFDGRYERE